MKIVHCIFSLNTGGAETMLIDIANEQVETCNVSVIIINCSYERYLLDSFDGRVNVITLDRDPSSRSIWFILRLNLILIKIHPDVLHLHSLTIAALIFPFKRYKLFYTVHDLNIPSRYSSRISKMFAISDAVCDDMSCRTKCPVVVIPNGINTLRIKPRIHSDESSFKIIQVARLDSSKKGQDILIKALSILSQRGIDNVFVDFIGDGSSYNELLELTHKLRLDGKVNFCGLQNRDYIYNHLCNYDCMCHPARYEGFGLVVAEGMAAGLPLIVSNEGGPYEIIGKGEYGLSFKNGDENDLADKILYLMQNYKEMLNIAEKARSNYVNKYSIKRQVSDYFKEYKKV